MIYTPWSHPWCIWLSFFKHSYIKNVLALQSFTMAVNGHKSANIHHKRAFIHHKCSTGSLIKGFWGEAFMSRFKTLSSKITTREKSHSGHRKQAQCEKPFVTSLEDRLKQTRANRHRTETENIYIPNKLRL